MRELFDAWTLPTGRGSMPALIAHRTPSQAYGSGAGPGVARPGQLVGHLFAFSESAQ